MQRSYKIISACFSAALLVACGGNNGLSSSTPMSVAPLITEPQSASRIKTPYGVLHSRVAKADYNSVPPLINGWGEFSIMNNPNGVWSYLFTQASTPALLTVPENPCAALGVGYSFPGLECWWNNQGQPSSALVEYNATNGVLHFLTVDLPKHYLALDPESNANVAVEFTPNKKRGGLYTLKGKFLGVDRYQSGHTVEVLEDDTAVLFAGSISTYGQKLQFRHIQCVSA